MVAMMYHHDNANVSGMNHVRVNSNVLVHGGGPADVFAEWLLLPDTVNNMLCADCSHQGTYVHRNTYVQVYAYRSIMTHQTCMFPFVDDSGVFRDTCVWRNGSYQCATLVDDTTLAVNTWGGCGADTTRIVGSNIIDEALLNSGEFSSLTHTVHESFVMICVMMSFVSLLVVFAVGYVSVVCPVRRENGNSRAGV
jgi:hypothetical protein